MERLWNNGISYNCLEADVTYSIPHSIGGMGGPWNIMLLFRNKISNTLLCIVLGGGVGKGRTMDYLFIV